MATEISNLEERIRALELELAALKVSIDAWRKYTADLICHQETYYKRVAVVTTTLVSVIVGLLVQVVNMLQ